MNDNIKDMRRLLPSLLIILSLTACPAGFSPSGAVSGAAGGGTPGAILGGGGDTVAAGGDVPGGATAGSPGGDLRPKADPEIVYPIRLGGGTAVTITEFRMFNGATLTHLV